MEKAVKDFNKTFRPWDIKLPDTNITKRQRGIIQKNGWIIKFLFSKDSKGEYLDYYAVHKMTNDSHIRIYDDGSMKILEVPPIWGVCLEYPKEDQKSKEEYEQECKRIINSLIKKGFW